MAYPDLPNNRLIVGGVDLSEEYGMILQDGYTLEPPKPKTYVVDIPGGNGKLDLTESLLGDVVYDNRSQEFTFIVINPDDYEKEKTRISNFLHGRAFDYKMTMDPEYTYHGRFTITSYGHSMYDIGKVGAIVVSVDANPFKMKDEQIYNVDAVGGIMVTLLSGRMSVCPIIETSRTTKVIFNNKLIVLTPGAWKINDITLKEGENQIYLNSYDVHNYTWGDLITNSVTWGDFKTKRLFEWYKSNGTGNILMKTWDEVDESTWSDLSVLRWVDLVKVEDVPTDIENVIIKYDWGDL